MNAHVFIFARGGSKGLPGKNIKLLGGIPLVAHSIRIAKNISAVNKIFVSTDDEGIAEVAWRYGAEVIMRPSELATDTASEWLAWQHAIRYVHGTVGIFDMFISLPATSPLRTVADVEECIASLTVDTDIVVTVQHASRNPYFNMLIRDEGGYSRLFMPDTVSRRQDAPQVYDMTTVAYVARPSYILASSGIFQGRVRSVVVAKEHAIDIDDEFDFRVAEALYRNGSYGLKE